MDDMAKDDKEENNPEELPEHKECEREPQTDMVALQCDEDETNAD